MALCMRNWAEEDFCGEKLVLVFFMALEVELCQLRRRSGRTEGLPPEAEAEDALCCAARRISETLMGREPMRSRRLGFFCGRWTMPGAKMDVAAVSAIARGAAALTGAGPRG